MKRAIAAVTLAALAACATPLRKAGVTPEQASRDHYECEKETLDSHARDWMIRAMYMDCMRARGYK